MISLAPAAVSLATASTRYFGEPIQLNEYPAGGNSTVYGELKGYNITPLEGKTFFYATNEKSLVLNDELIKKIDENTTKITSYHIISSLYPKSDNTSGESFIIILIFITSLTGGITCSIKNFLSGSNKISFSLK